MLHVLFLNYEYPPLGGGAATATRFLLRELSRSGECTVDLVTSSTAARRVEELFPRVRGHFLDIGKAGSVHYQSTADLLRYTFESLAYARALCRRRTFHVTQAFFTVPCGFVARFLKIPYLVSLRGSDVPGYSPRFALPDRLLFRSLSPWIWRGAHKVTALSKTLEELARTSSPTQTIEVLPNGIDANLFRPPSGSLAPRPFVLLFAGRLVPHKGVLDLLDAFELLGPEEPRTELLIAGDGPLRDELTARIGRDGLQDRVRLLGIVPRQDMAALYGMAHVVVIPSWSEALGNVTLEAMASGLPVVTTPTGAAEMIDGNGLVVPMRCPAKLAEAIRRLRDDEGLRRGFGSRSRALALGRSWEIVARRHLELYRGAVADSESP